ncbi:MAG: DNA gyrase subunit A [Anaerolineaceae bacterium]|nr:DNA gyrase subunit A [Anaerolineaceae bacterium]
MENDNINRVDLDQQMREAYLDYAMSVIVSRALPDARDGLKPVHRRILYAMDAMGVRSNVPHKKSARIVGEVLGKYHPHGDASIYDAMARMAQDFSMRYPLVDGHGNFGSIDGDPPAAMRYTEARLKKLSDELLADIDKETIDFMPNFDGSEKEPAVLPSKVPNLLLNGSNGIAVGMATNIPSHNLREINSALAYMIDNYDHVDEITVEDLMQFVKGPDFPTGGCIIGREGIKQAYTTGKGRIIVRARSHIEEVNGRFHIIVTEIPYQVNKTTLLERIADLVRTGQIDTIHDMRDESDREGMRIVIELKKTAQPQAVLNTLYKHTMLQTTFGAQMLALVDNRPVYLSLKSALEIFIKHRLEVIERRADFDLRKARARSHILAGLLIALSNLDEVIRIIRNAPDSDSAKTQLMERFELSEIQAQAILDMQLRRLSALERWKIEEEQKQLIEKIADLEDLLASKERQLKVVETETDEVTKAYGDERRTSIEADELEGFSEGDLVSERGVFVTMTQNGYIKRVDATTYRQYNRGAQGVTGHTMKDEDKVANILFVNTHDRMLFFTDKGKVYAEDVFRIPESSRTGKGLPVINIINIQGDEKVTAMLPIRETDSDQYLVMATANGKIKRNRLKDYMNIRSNGLIAISLDDDDRLTWVCQTDGHMNILMVSRNGKCLRFKENTVRTMGRTARGVNSMKMIGDDRLVYVGVARDQDDLLIVHERGIGKRTPVALIPIHGRTTGGQKITNTNAFEKIGKIAAGLVLHANDDVTFMSSKGHVVRLRGSLIPSLGRTARGVRLVRLEEDTVVAGVTANDHDAIPESPDEQTVTELPNDPSLPPEEDLPADDDADVEDDIAEDDADEETEDEEDPSGDLSENEE